MTIEPLAVVEKLEDLPCCVNCRVSRNCIIAKTLRDFKGLIQTVGLHCSDWEAELNG